jgi:NAD(P)-dependent dehydrogenase (short-subunit alcohol dehydrogenase family)
VQVLPDLHSETSLPYRPSIVAISSAAARRPMRTSTIYCATKAALDQAVRVMARELASAGWRINAVAPGKVMDTNMTRYVDAKVRELRGWTEEYAQAYEAASNALGMPAMPDAVAQVVLDVLFGPPSLNGAIIDVNGGR